MKEFSVDLQCGSSVTDMATSAVGRRKKGGPEPAVPRRTGG